MHDQFEIYYLVAFGCGLLVGIPLAIMLGTIIGDALAPMPQPYKRRTKLKPRS